MDWSQTPQWIGFIFQEQKEEQSSSGCCDWREKGQ